jgi:hypothetical protein
MSEEENELRTKLERVFGPKLASELPSYGDELAKKTLDYSEEAQEFFFKKTSSIIKGFLAKNNEDIPKTIIATNISSALLLIRKEAWIPIIFLAIAGARELLEVVDQSNKPSQTEDL